MKLLHGLACLLLCQSAGEVLSRLFHLPLPGPVVGLLILLVALQASPVREAAGAAAEALLAHFSLLFVPVGLGVITHLDLIRQYGLQLILVLVLSTWIGLLATALTLRALLRRADARRQAG